jgi:chromosome segregation ATPase
MPMTFLDTLRAAALAALLAMPAAAQDAGGQTTADEVRAEISDAMDAVATYSAQERDEALAEARAALDRLDAEIEAREQALREGWAEMSDTARDTARARLQDLRAARNRLGERFGALQAGTTSAWDEVQAGFTDAWEAFSEAWSAADDDASSN